MKHPEFNFDAEPEEPQEEPAVTPRSAAGTASAAVLERIKKLLRLAADKRGNPHEAERAAALAFDLAERHHVDVASLDLDEQVEQLLGEYFNFGSRMDTVKQGALRIVQSFFHVEACLSFPRVLFVGRSTDVQIAGYVFTFLQRAARDCLKSWEQREKTNRRRVTTGKRKNYTAGFFYGITDNLRATRVALQLGDAKNALILAEETKRKAKLEELVPDRVTVKGPKQARRNLTALTAGFRDGKETKINQPLNGGKREVLAIQ